MVCSSITRRDAMTNVMTSSHLEAIGPLPARGVTAAWIALHTQTQQAWATTPIPVHKNLFPWDSVAGSHQKRESSASRIVIFRPDARQHHLELMKR
ncbi:hypothetical protein TNCT_481311 [Trichonephila clavata]|uniref:Uncharacterized protein n=1 Tax=Trichonephila clavata TaxID=2740835 RepID=A0A8X6LFW5_TRICU|nr:hypothetical protein TNCT_481311 [Trichonephila clavata]